MKETKSLLLRAFRAPQYVTWWTYAFLRNNPFVWRLLNSAGNNLYEEHPPKLDAVQKSLVESLVENGIALVHLDELFPGKNVTSNLIEHAQLREEKAKVGTNKTFLRYMWGGRDGNPLFDLENPFIRFSVEPRVLDIVNSYMTTCSKLIYFELAMTNLMRTGTAPMVSQRWHRDPGMKRIIKIFVYVSDVDEESGPFTYVLRSHWGGQWRKLFPQKQFGRRGMYPPEGAVDKVVPQSDIKVCVGRAGTVIFCDTSGLHKGGYSSSKPRIMHTSVYVAGADLIKPLFRHPGGFNERLATLNPVSQFAVRFRKEWFG